MIISTLGWEDLGSPGAGRLAKTKTVRVTPRCNMIAGAEPEVAATGHDRFCALKAGIGITSEDARR